MASDITIYTTGDKQHGLGHVVRMRLLARLLVERGLNVTFCSIPNTPGWSLLERTGLRLTDHLVPAEVGIIDIENGPDEDDLVTMGNACVQVVAVYGGHSFPLREPGADAAEQMSDLVVCQSIFKFDRPAHVLQGAEYLIIDPRYSQNKTDPDGPLLVVMGGTDPHDLTPRITEYFDRFHYRYSAPRGKPDLVAEMWGKSIFIGAQGMVAYEAIAAGLPCLLYGWVDNAVATAQELERQGVAYSMGLWSDFDMRKLVDMIGRGYWQLKSGKPRIVDGQGAGRVADAICKLVQEPMHERL